MSLRALPIIAWLLVCCGTASAEERVLVAVASNFLPTAKTIAETFTRATGIPVQLSAGSSGKLYAQVVNGAPFDVFLSADEERPARLVDRGDAVASSRFTYATGRLVLWSGDPDLDGADCVTALKRGDGYVAIANPVTAPYGRAASEYLSNDNIDVSGRQVTGENITQALQFAVRGGARFGLLARSQASMLPPGGCRFDVPVDRHAPIAQQAVLLTRAADKASAVRFLEFLAQDARAVIVAAGYELADD